MSLLEEEKLKRDLSDIVRLAGGNGKTNRMVDAETWGPTTSHRVESLSGSTPRFIRTSLPCASISKR